MHGYWLPAFQIFFSLGCSHRLFRWQSDPAVAVAGEGSNAVISACESPGAPRSCCSVTDDWELGGKCFNGKVEMI